MKYCQHCGSEMKLEDRYCQNCGADSQVIQATPSTDTSVNQDSVTSTQDAEASTPETVSSPQDLEDETKATSSVILESDTTSQEFVAMNQEEPVESIQTEPSFTQVTPPTPSNPNGIETKFNWGAFVSPFSFGIAHKTYLGLLSLLIIIPILGWIFAIVWAFVFGFNGEKWALENSANQYRDDEEFRKVMSPWNRYGFVGFIIAAAVIVIYIIILILLISSVPHYNNYNY